MRTHEIPSGSQRTSENIVGTLAHEIGHNLGLLHTHHPGRFASLLSNNGIGEGNGTISNGCYQESVSRVKKNYWYDGCLTTDNKLKCEINGDFLCDTQADPNQTRRVSGCVYNLPSSGDFREDNWGDLWTPPTHNVLSYTTGDCRNEFSRSQTGIMWMQMPNFQSYINYQVPTIAATPDVVCTGVPLSFALVGTLPSDAAISWVVEPAWLVTVSSGTGTFANLSSTSSGSGNITYTITGPGNCYIARAQMWFTVGSYPSYIPSGYAEECSSIPIRFDAVPATSPPIQADLYRWSLDGNLLEEGYNSYIYVQLPVGSYRIGLQTSNACGWSPIELSDWFTIFNCGFYSYSIYPNTVSTQFTVMQTINQSVTQDSKQIKSPGNFEIRIFDRFGQDLKSYVSKDSNLNVNTRDLPSGIYYLRITDETGTTSQRIIVDH